MIKLQFAVTVLQYEEDPTVGKNIAQLGEFAVALSRGEIDAENVDNVIANLDKLGLIPWDKTQVRRTFLTETLRSNDVTATRTTLKK